MLDPFEINRIRGCACGAAEMADSLRALLARPLPKYLKTELESYAKRMDYQWATLTRMCDKLEGK